ncbi:RNA-directed DNA polymerase, eukaryota, reverse transcriptase zinc-binding domain protein [Tanacetum coccineum]|uniref:RNA-directed DNA polymerase, eukaryota, reverse transcriptase zinc-binding domain protein n=1 Tax=Tanacetum coccineum TaxID=301880 RepID=A0ABQ4ZAC0_9ASTR
MNTCTSFISALLPTASPHDCNVQKSKMGDRHIGTSSTIGNTLLEYVVREEDLIPSIDKKRIVDETMRTKKVISNEDMVEWSHEMKRYFKDKKELFETAIELEKDENVLEVNKGEGAAGKNIFGSWEFVSNGEDNNKGCKIMVGWNPGMLKVWLINKSKQCMFFLVETICHQTKFFCAVVYASNSCLERWKLWKELENQKSITNGNPWVVMGDFNVTLKVEEHSNGSSNPSSEMVEFQDCIRKVEIKDILSSGFQFTWTKSLKNPKCRTLKKLDRIMSNEVFIDKYQQAHGVFLPYLISDHSPAVLNIPKAMRRKKGAFRFSNFITDKEEFLPIVKDA